MRIRPAFLTAFGTLIALTAVATVILVTTPHEAGAGLIRLLWVAIFLAAWGLSATMLLLLRQSVAQAVWVGLWPALAAVALLMVRHNRPVSGQLLVGVILATLAVSIETWRRLRRISNHDR